MVWASMVDLRVEGFRAQGVHGRGFRGPFKERAVLRLRAGFAAVE